MYVYSIINNVRLSLNLCLAVNDYEITWVLQKGSE